MSVQCNKKTLKVFFLLLYFRITHDNTANLLGQLKYRKGSASTVNTAERGSKVGGVEEGVKSVTQPKTSATPQVLGLVRASSRNVREMNGSVSPAIHMVSAFFLQIYPALLAL